MKNIVILTNLMTPYRKFFYDKLYDEFKKNNFNFWVLLMSDTEGDRHWSYDNFKTNYTILLEHKTVRIGGIEIHLNKNIDKKLKELNPDIVICGGSYLYPTVWRTINLRKKLKYILLNWSESHLKEEKNYNYFKLKIREFFRKKIIKKFDGFWYVGKFSKEFVMKYGRKEADYVFVPNLINKDKFETKVNQEKVKKKYDIKEHRKIFITPARLTKVKGIIEFLNLYRKCDCDKVTYFIAGDGELKGQIEDIINKNKLDIRLIGYRSENEMIELYSICNGLILPSLSDPNPLSCIEACWCKLPLLVSNHVGNYPEIVKENFNGYVIDYSNEQESINKINKFINSSREWEENAKIVSYSVATEIYNPDIVIKRVVEETIRLIEK